MTEILVDDINNKSSQKDTNEKKCLFFCMITTFIWGIIAHAYCFLHSSFSHDSLTAFYATIYEEKAKIELGRFFAPIYRNIRGPVAMPWLIGILSLIWIGLAVFLIIKIFNVKSKKNIVFISGIMTVNITVIALLATYIFEADIDMFSLLMSILAVYIWKKKGWLAAVMIGAPCVMISIGLYQSYFAVTLSLIIFASIIELLENKSVKQVILKDIKAILMVLFGGGLYYALCALSYRITGIAQLDRTNVFKIEGISDLKVYYTELFKNTYIHFAEYIKNINVYPEYFEILIGVLLPIIVAFIIGYIFIKNKKIGILSKLFITVIGAILPFGINTTYFLARGEGVHDLMTYAIWLVFVMLLILVSWFNENCDIKTKKLKLIINCLVYGFLIVVLWQNVILSNMAYLKKDMESKATLSMMTRVVYNMESENDFVPGVTPVAFIGRPNVTKTHPGFDKVSNIVGLDNVSSITYYETYNAYFLYVLNYPLKLCSNSKLEQLKNSEFVKNIEPYPSNEYIKMIDGILVVKMGDIE